MADKKARVATNDRVCDPYTQSERFIAKARELGLDEREEEFDAALAKVAKSRFRTDAQDQTKEVERQRTKEI